MITQKTRNKSLMSVLINEQGCTETWYNSVHRYVMLHVFYKFAKKPKKK